MHQSDQLRVSGTSLAARAHPAGALALEKCVEDLDELWRRWLEYHDISAAMQLARTHRKLLVERVKSYTVPRRLSEDFIGEGHIGLIRAICRFDPDGTEDFPAFAIRHVDAALHDYAEFLLGERGRRPSMASESAGRKLAIS